MIKFSKALVLAACFSISSYQPAKAISWPSAVAGVSVMAGGTFCTAAGFVTTLDPFSNNDNRDKGAIMFLGGIAGMLLGAGLIGYSFAW